MVSMGRIVHCMPIRCYRASHEVKANMIGYIILHCTFVSIVSHEAKANMTGYIILHCTFVSIVSHEVKANMIGYIILHYTLLVLSHMRSKPT
jgi:hypothetical protein